MSSPHITTLPECQRGLPLVISATNPSVDGLLDWMSERQEELSRQLSEHGAILFRGFDAAEPESFERVARAIAPNLGKEYLGTSPRDAVREHVFHASELPGYYPIPQHCEMTFTKTPPTRLFFGCAVAPRRHGETPLCDFRQMYEDLDPGVRERFESRGVRIIRNYGAPDERGGLWQLKRWHEMFGTRDKDAVTAKAESEGFTVLWLGDKLRLTSQHPASRVHPETGRRAWFNHAQVFHLGAAAGEYRRIVALRPSPKNLLWWGVAASFGAAQRLTQDPESLTLHCTYGDGQEIPRADMEAVRDAIWRNLVHIPWQRGDVVAIDNGAVAHGRLPYRGPREILVCWS